MSTLFRYLFVNFLKRRLQPLTILGVADATALGSMHVQDRTLLSDSLDDAMPLLQEAERYLEIPTPRKKEFRTNLLYVAALRYIKVPRVLFACFRNAIEAMLSPQDFGLLLGVGGAHDEDLKNTVTRSS